MKRAAILCLCLLLAICPALCDTGTTFVDATPAPQGTPAPDDAAADAPKQRVIDPDKPMIALTFDDGPHPDVTPKILAVLEQYGVVATFFEVGGRIEASPDLPAVILAGGNEIGCHCWNHINLTTLSKNAATNQMRKVKERILELTGFQMRLMRPPGGSQNATVRAAAKSLDLALVNWSVDTEDWKTRNADKTYKAIIRGAKDGAIILCHDLYKTTAAAVEKAIPVLIEKGFQLVTVSELIQYRQGEITPGKLYRSVTKSTK